MTAQRRLAWNLVGAVAVAFVASLILTWLLHARMTKRSMLSLVDDLFSDVEVHIRERVDSMMLRRALMARDRIYEMREQPWWNDPDESSRQLRALAKDLGLDEVSVANDKGLLTHSSRREEVGLLDFTKVEGQAREFAALLDDKYEFAQGIQPNTMRGDIVKYVGVWLPDGGFVQVGGEAQSVRNISRTAVTGLSHGWHVSDGAGGVYITTAKGTIISHPEAGREGGQWRDPGEDCYCERRDIEGFPVYIVMPKRTAVVERRVLVLTSAFLNGAALVFAAVFVGIVIASYVRTQLAAQRAKEMKMASGIQEGAIPRTFPPFPDERRVDVFADMNTAKDVGGDFYDFYYTGPTRITFLVADVSGKGVPAALFMMRAKTTIKGISQTGKPLADAVREVNETLCLDNGANMFVTAWIGEIDMETGKVTYVNAGHNPPLVLRAKPGADGSRVSYLRTNPGLMLGMMSGMPYNSGTIMLEPGDALYLYTDGITEQPDEKNVLFGEDRLKETIEGLLSNGTELFTGARATLLKTVLACVQAHGLGVEQADDCTQLLLRYNGPCAGQNGDNLI